MNLNDVHRGIHKRKRPKRVGRGPGSGRGKTSGRGHKGQGQLAGWSQSPGFEGGQFPLFRRVPKRGFHNRFAPLVVAVNLNQLERWFDAGAEVSPESLRTSGRVRRRYDLLKILAGGKLTKRLTVTAHRFSAAAKAAIEQAGGKAIELAGPAPVGQKEAAPAPPAPRKRTRGQAPQGE